MERIKRLNGYQRGILVLLAIFVLVFSVVYVVTCTRVGFLYNDTIFDVAEQDGILIYTGKLNGEVCYFSVAPETAVTFRYGNRVFGPYTVKEDSTAVPKEHSLGERMRGVEVRENNAVIFRGGIYAFDLGGVEPQWLLIREDGSDAGASVLNGDLPADHIGQVSDQMEPSVSTILHLLYEPELTHKGHWIAYIAGALCTIVTAVSVIYADELFRWRLSFRVRDAYWAEPSDWEIVSRYVSWTLVTGLSVVIFVIGLQ